MLQERHIAYNSIRTPLSFNTWIFIALSIIKASPLLLFLVLASSLVGCSNPSEPWPESDWSPYPAEYGMKVQRSVPVVMDDGATLYVDIGYPTNRSTGERAAGDFPVLLTQNQYMLPGTNSSVFPPMKFFVSRGYIYVVAQVRGTGKTEGPDGAPLALDMFSPRMAKDGAQLVDWVANVMEGSNGSVGLDGCSFLGITQLFTAAELGPNSPVKAIVPACAGNSYELYFPGGMMAATTELYSFTPGMVIAGRRNYNSNVANQGQLAERQQRGEDEAYNRDHWQARDTINTVENIVANDIPVLLWTGWYAAEMKDAVKLYVGLQNASAGMPIKGPMSSQQPISGKYQIIIGPNGHGEGIQSNNIKLQWFDHWVKGWNTGIENTKQPMNLIELNQKRWLQASRFPAVDNYTSLYVDANGTLTQTIPDEGESESLTWTKPRKEGGKIIFSSSSFTEASLIAGAPSTTVWARSSNANMQLIVTLFDVAPDGKAREITHGTLLGSMRELDADNSWLDAAGNMIFPQYKFESDSYLEPGLPYRLDIAMFPTLWQLESGHSLRLELTTQSSSKDCNLTALLDRPRPCGLTDPQKETLPGGVYHVLMGGDTPTGIHLPLM